MRMNTTVKRVLLCALMIGAGAKCAAERVPVVAVTPFKQYFDMGKGWDRQVVSVRDQVVAELVRDYDCVVLNRSCNYSLALEDAVKRLSAVSEPGFKPEVLYGTDLSFTGVFQPGVTNIECVLRMADLRAGKASASRSVTVGVPSIEGCAPRLAEAIAQAAGISKRSQPRSSDLTAGTLRTWVTLPFAVAQGKNSLLERGGELGTTMQLRAEAVVQKNARNRLVDHTALDAVLKEHAAAGLNDTSDFGRVSRLVGADRVLLGLVSAEKDKSLRVDLLAVDAQSTEVLAAVTARCATHDALGQELEKAVGALLAAVGAPTPLVPASAEQRVREARLCLESAAADANAMALSGNLAVLDYVEMAYLVARDNPEVIRAIIKTLSRCTVSESGITQSTKGSLAQVADKIVSPYAEIANAPDVLLARAQAHVAGGNFEAGYRLIDQLAKSCPDRMDDDVRRVMGECHLELGRPREALACLGKGDDHFRTLQMRARAYRALGDEAGEFAVMNTMTHNQLRDLLVHYLELLAKNKGPKAAVDFINESMRNDSWLSPRTDIQFLLAKYSMAAGDRPGAAKICQRLWEEGQSSNWNWFYVGDCQAFKKQLEELKAQAGASEEKWLKACEIQPFPPTCAMYIQPLGSLDTNLLEVVRAGMQAFFGARTVILPALELTTDEPSYIKASNKYDAGRLLPDTLKRLKVPADALAVAMVTRENICADGYAWIYSRRVENGVLCSYFVWLRQNQKVREICLRNAVIDNISNTLKLMGRFPCITASTGDDTSSLKKKFAYCPDVQAKYKALDLEDEQRKSIKLFKAAGATIVPKP